MVVRKDNSGRVHGKGFFDDFARINGGAVDGASKKLIKAQHAVPVIKIKAAEQLVIEVLHTSFQKCLGVSRALD
jgi:hypothetical protein